MSNNWRPTTELPDKSVEQIWYHTGDGNAYMSSKPKKETWPEWRDIVHDVNIVGWQPIVPPAAPQPPTQKELDDAAMLVAFRGQGLDHALQSEHMLPCELPLDFQTGWNLALLHARGGPQ